MHRRAFLRSLGASGAGALALAAFAGRATRAADEAAPAPAGAAPAAGPESARAWDELEATLAELEAGFAAPAWRLAGPADFAEGRRFLGHVLHHALECWLEADPDRPVFKRFVTPEKKLLGDNPDAVYFTAPVSPTRRYRIRGNLAGATYTSFTVELGTAGGAVSQRVGATLNDTGFEAGPDGSYEILVGPEEQPGNGLRLDPEAGSITTRHYYERERSVAADRLHHVPITIEPLDPPPPPPPPGDASVAEGLRRVSRFLRGTVRPLGEAVQAPAWVSTVPNQLPAPTRRSGNEEVGFAAVDNVYSMAPYLLKPGQALVIRGRHPRCRFANVVLWNRFLQTYDYLNRTVSLNRRQTRLEEDGSFRMVLAHEDPGVPNWLDTEGRPFGQIFWRFLLPEEDIEPLRTQVVPIAEVGTA